MGKAMINRQAGYEYAFESGQLEAGIAFLGWEAKAVRENRVNLNQAVVKIVNGEVYLFNCQLFSANAKPGDTDRKRKLLLKKSEITALTTKIKAKRLTLIPTRFYTKGRLIKLEVRLGKPKRQFEKREALKKRDLMGTIGFRR